MAVSKRLRFEVFRRDNHTCRYCGDGPPDVKLTVDHVVPQALGGSDEPSNLVTACVDCNAGKTSVFPDAPLVDDVEQDALRWSKAMERAAELQRQEQGELRIMCQSLRDFWVDIWGEEASRRPSVLEGPWVRPGTPEVTYEWAVDVNGRIVDLFHDETDAQDLAESIRVENAPPMPDDWQASARAWTRAGIRSQDYVPLMYMVRDERKHVQWDRRWKYFAGCVWSVIRERQTIASDLLEAGTEDDTGVPW